MFKDTCLHSLAAQTQALCLESRSRALARSLRCRRWLTELVGAQIVDGRGGGWASLYSPLEIEFVKFKLNFLVGLRRKKEKGAYRRALHVSERERGRGAGWAMWVERNGAG